MKFHFVCPYFQRGYATLKGKCGRSPATHRSGLHHYTIGGLHLFIYRIRMNSFTGRAKLNCDASRDELVWVELEGFHDGHAINIALR